MTLLRTLLLLLAAAALALPGRAQTAPDRTAAARSTVPVRLVEIYGPRTLATGAIANFRVRTSNGSPIRFTALWDFGDDVLSAGNPVAHVYHAPGTYTVTVIGRNAAGADTLATQVTVTGSAPAPISASAADPSPGQDAATAQPASLEAPAESLATAEEVPPRPVRRVRQSAIRGARPVAAADGGYTWVVKSGLWKEPLETALLAYRLRNYRTGVVRDDHASGAPAYRLVVGHFHTPQEAVAARAWLPPGTDGAWLLDLRSLH